MPMHTTRLALAALLISTPLAAANATDYLSVNVGQFEAIRDNTFDAWQFGAEYRFGAWEYNLHPMIGGFFTSDGSVYGYGGLNWDIELMPNQLYLIPNFAVGAYGEGDGKDLGGTLEFRSGIELDYQLPNAHRVGIILNHISNAGIYSHNPGEESILVNYSIPMGSLAR